jgi:hypothetical protein
MNPHNDTDLWWIFRGSRTPPALYARQKWLGEANTAAWQQDFERTVAELRQGQGKDGLWQDSILVTVQRLFGLHLTVREADAPIDRSLDAIIDLASAPQGDIGGQDPADKAFHGLPFTPSRWMDFFLPATLFLASIFGRADDSRIRNLYESLLSPLVERPVDDWPPATLHNILRAVVVQPHYARHPATEAVIRWYARRQTPNGDWGTEIPFYQALNALAHLKHAAAEEQCCKAFESLAARRNPDGSWGLRQPQWATFLTTHALRNKGRLALPSTP